MIKDIYCFWEVVVYFAMLVMLCTDIDEGLSLNLLLDCFFLLWQTFLTAFKHDHMEHMMSQPAHNKTLVLLHYSFI